MLLRCDSSSSDDSADCEAERGGADGGQADAGPRAPLTDFLHFPCSAPGSSFEATDEITCAVAHRDVLVLGTRSGSVLGWRPGCGAPFRIRKHAERVLCVALDDSGAFVGSSSQDSSVAVGPLDPPEIEDEEARADWVCTYPRAVLSMAFCPSYASGGFESRSLCVGGEECKLVLTRRGLFAPKHVTVHAGEGPIDGVRWRGPLIAWSNARGVKVVDVETYQKVTHIPRPPSAAPDGEGGEPRCCLTWAADDALLVGWGALVMVAVVRQKRGGPAGVRFASVAHSFRLPSGSIFGLAAFDARHIVVTTAAGGGRGGHDDARVAHHVCTWAGRVISSERLPLDGGGQPSLASSRDGVGPQYIVTAGDVVATRRRTVPDHATWLIDHGCFEVAIALLRSTQGLGAAEIAKIPSLCVAPLLARGRPRRAVGIVRQLGLTDGEAWQECIRLFEDAGQLPLLVPEIPVPPAGPALPRDVYDAVLRRLAAASPEALRATLERWPGGTFSLAPLIELLRQRLPEAAAGRPPDGAPPVPESLVEALALLLEAEGDLVGASRLLVGAGGERLFPFLARHLPGDAALRAGAAADFARLFDLCPGEALALAVRHPAAFAPRRVLEAVAPAGRWWEQRYLGLLLQEQTTLAEFHEVHVRLCTEFQPHNAARCIGPLLADEGNDIVGSETLKDAGLVHVHLPSFRAQGALDAEGLLIERHGHFKDALALSIHGAGDVLGALHVIDRAPSEIAQELWSMLIHRISGDSRAYSLLMCLSVLGVQPPLPCATQGKLLHQLPAGLEIPQLPLKITRALDDAESDKDVHLLTLRREQSLTASLSRKTFKQQRRGMAVVSSKEESKTTSATSQELVRRPWRIPWRRAALSLL